MDRSSNCVLKLENRRFFRCDWIVRKGSFFCSFSIVHSLNVSQIIHNMLSKTQNKKPLLRKTETNFGLNRHFLFVPFVIWICDTSLFFIYVYYLLRKFELYFIRIWLISKSCFSFNALFFQRVNFVVSVTATVTFVRSNVSQTAEHNRTNSFCIFH